MEETEIFICQCHSIEHQIKFYKTIDKFDDGHEHEEVNCIIHLTAHKNIFKRIWYAIKYIFGFKSRFGAWDEFVFKVEDAQKLQEFLNREFEKDS